MPSMAASIAYSQFETRLRNGFEIFWEQIVELENVVGGEIRIENRDTCYQGIISAINLKDGVVFIECPWLLQTPVDEDGDPIGDFSPSGWVLAKDAKLPITFPVPVKKFSSEEVVIYTTREVYPNGNWAVRSSDTTITFWGGTATIYLKGDMSNSKSIKEIAQNLGLSIP